MPTLTNLEGLALHSPSTQIVGTPFDSPSKFEYPVSSAESTSSAHASSFPTLLSPLSSGGSFPFFSALASSAQLTLLGLIHSEVSSSSSSTSSTSSFKPVHPKLKPLANPPIPPSLVKKRARWSLGKGRRKNSFEGQDETSLEAALRGEHDGVLLPRDEGGRAKH